MGRVYRKLKHSILLLQRLAQKKKKRGERGGEERKGKKTGLAFLVHFTRASIKAFLFRRALKDDDKGDAEVNSHGWGRGGLKQFHNPSDFPFLIGIMKPIMNIKSCSLNQRLGTDALQLWTQQE